MMLCCSLLLDMACHTTRYWHLFMPFPCLCSRLGWGWDLAMIPRRGSSVEAFAHSTSELSAYSYLLWLPLQGPVKTILTISFTIKMAILLKQILVFKTLFIGSFKNIIIMTFTVKNIISALISVVILHFICLYPVIHTTVFIWLL